MASLLNAQKQKKFHSQLYLHHIYSGKDRNQTNAASPNQPSSFGSINVQDWSITDGPKTNAKVVARAQGVHIQANMGSYRAWYNSMSIVFQDASSHKGSTLEVMGIGVIDGEWAIVGGTGEFTMAQGVIYKKLYEGTGGHDTVELNIHAYYYPKDSLVDGGNATGGNASGGAATGGNAVGGNATGGNATGGSATGGNASGGNATGGNASGGAATGGNASGGNTMGGNATGGSAAGGNASGGNATGGNASGGAATGGNATGGNASTN